MMRCNPNPEAEHGPEGVFKCNDRARANCSMASIWRVSRREGTGDQHCPICGMTEVKRGSGRGLEQVCEVMWHRARYVVWLWVIGFKLKLWTVEVCAVSLHKGRRIIVMNQFNDHKCLTYVYERQHESCQPSHITMMMGYVHKYKYMNKKWLLHIKSLFKCICHSWRCQVYFSLNSSMCKFMEALNSGRLSKSSPAWK